MQALAQTWKHWHYQYYLQVYWTDDGLWLSVQQRRGDTRQPPTAKHFVTRWEDAKSISATVRWPPSAQFGVISDYAGKPLAFSPLTESDGLAQIKASLHERADKIQAVQARFGPDMPPAYRSELLHTAQAIIDYWQSGGKDKPCCLARWKFEHAPVNFGGPHCSTALGHSFVGLDPDD